MQEEEKNNGMEGMSVEEMFLGVQESYQEAQLRAQEENRLSPVRSSSAWTSSGLTVSVSCPSLPIRTLADTSGL